MNHKYTVYRIKAQLEGVLGPPEGEVKSQQALRVTYDLHPEDGLPISRVAFGRKCEIWLNTDSDYKVRASANDGREWDLGWVSEALKRGLVRTNVLAGYVSKVSPVFLMFPEGQSLLDIREHIGDLVYEPAASVAKERSRRQMILGSSFGKATQERLR